MSGFEGETGDDVRRPLTPLTTRILLTLADGRPRHGYGLLKSLATQEAGESVPQTGSLYLALHRIADRGWIEEVKGAGGDDADARRRYWRLTDRGRAALETEIQRLRRILDMAIQTI